ncbi:Cytoplasmic protein, partial [Monkeypox virus]
SKRKHDSRRLQEQE